MLKIVGHWGFKVRFIRCKMGSVGTSHTPQEKPSASEPHIVSRRHWRIMNKKDHASTFKDILSGLYRFMTPSLQPYRDLGDKSKRKHLTKTKLWKLLQKSSQEPKHSNKRRFTPESPNTTLFQLFNSAWLIIDIALSQRVQVLKTAFDRRWLFFGVSGLAYQGI